MMGDESVPNTTLLEKLYNVYSKIGALKYINLNQIQIIKWRREQYINNRNAKLEIQDRTNST